MIENTGNQVNSGVKQGDGSPSSTVYNGDTAARREATMAYLSQVEELSREIRLKKNKISIKRDALSVRSPVLSDMPKAPSPNLQPMAERICDILTLEDEVKDAEAQMAGTKAEMMTMIEKLSNMNSQMVLVTAFLNLRSTNQACRDLHMSRGWYLKQKAAAITEIETILDNEGELIKWIR